MKPADISCPITTMEAPSLYTCANLSSSIHALASLTYSNVHARIVHKGDVAALLQLNLSKGREMKCSREAFETVTIFDE